MILPDMHGIYGSFSNFSRIITLFGAGGKDGKSWLTAVSKRMKKEGKWSTASPYYTFRHELGHALQQKLKSTDKNYSEKLEKISLIRKNIFDSLTNIDESAIIDITKKTLSIYGLENDSELDEFISECVAEYCNGKPRSIAKSIVEILLS